MRCNFDQFDIMEMNRRGRIETIFCILLALTVRAHAESEAQKAVEILHHVPAGVPGVLVLPRPAAANQALSDLARRINPNYEPISLDCLADHLDVNRESWDPTAPVAIILTKPELKRTSMVVAFRARRDADRDTDKSKTICRGERPSGRCWTMARDGLIFCASRRSALRSLSALEGKSTLAADLDDSERAFLDGADAVVRVNLDPWRQRLDSYVTLAANMMKLGITASTDPQAIAATHALLDWMIGGVNKVVEEMRTVTVAATIRGDMLRLTHHHRFRPGGAVGTYLASVRNNKLDMLATLPNRPFWLVATTNWQCPAESSVTARMTEYVLNLNSGDAAISPKTKNRFISEVRACYSQTRGTSLMMSSGDESLFPLQLSGSYVYEDARKGLAQMCFVQENACETLSMFVPIGDMHTKFQVRRVGDLEISEMKPDLSRLSRKMRDDLSQAYGPEIRYQYVALDDREVMFYMGQTPSGVADLARKRTTDKETLAGDPSVQRLVKALPDAPNIFVAVDLRRLLDELPAIAKITVSDDDGERVPVLPVAHGEGRQAARPDPALLGWSLTVGRNSITGCLAMNANDLVETTAAARRAFSELHSAKSSQPAE